MEKNIMERLRGTLSPPVIMLIVAILIAVIVSYLSYGLIKKETAAKTTQGNTQQVAVAAFEIKWGTVITQEMVKTQPYLTGSLPSGYISDPSKAIGRVAIYPVQVNEPITESRLAPVSVTKGGVAALVTPKKRAMTVKVDKVVGVSGFVLPGHRVDIMVTLPPNEKVLQPITKIVLENMFVLASGTQLEQPPEGKGKSIQVDVITFEVTPEEAEKLALAASQGKIQLALRNYTDTEEVLTRGAVVTNLLSSYSGGAIEPQRAPAVQRSVSRPRQAPAAVIKTLKPQEASISQPPAEVFTVELIEGGKVSNVKFSKGVNNDSK